MMQNRRSSRPFRSGAVVLVLCACSDDALKLGDSDQQSKGDASSSGGGSGQGGGASGSSAGGSGNVGAAGSGGASGTTAGAQDGGADVGSDGSLGAGASCAGGSPGQPWWRYTNAQNCQSEGVPLASDRPDSACEGSSIPAIHLAMSRLRLSAQDDAALSPSETAWRDIGFDLDKRCTSSETCQASGQPINEQGCRQGGATLPFDGNQCRDNEIGKLFRTMSSAVTLGTWFGLTEADWNCELHRGGFGILFTISEYNGALNDPQVRVDVYSTVGVETLPGWACRARPEDPLDPAWTSHAPWSPSQPWKIARRSLALTSSGGGTDLPRARYADPAAFVRNGYLVAQLPPGTELWLNGARTPTPGFRVILYRGVLTGALVKLPNGTWTIDDGTLGGAVFPSDWVSGLREIGFCENMCAAYNTLRVQVMESADALAATLDILPTADCDALSLGAKFQARQATATAANIADSAPVDCPNPKHPGAPRQGCLCNPQGGCDGGGGFDGGP
jgi:hypothetical protein